MRKTKIICTLGPAVDSDEKIHQLMLNGMDCARLNFSHGTHEEQKMRMDRVKKVRKELSLPIPLMLDTKGPEIRVGDFENGFAILKEGQTFIFDCNLDMPGNETRVGITHGGLLASVIKQGTGILLDDGKISLCVTEVNKDKIICQVINQGRISNHKSINVPNLNVPMPYMSEQDKSDILFGIQQEVDYIAASFVRSADDVIELKKFLNENGGKGIKVISKIENKMGVDNIESIISESDGIMVARGDLGVEIPFKQIPALQKMMISKCIKSGKIVVTATQMLESMTESPRPTRAETSDVANAIYDGTTAIMLSGESAAGKYPIEAVKTMAEIAECTEESIGSNNMRKENCKLAQEIADTVCSAACGAAEYMGAAAIIAVTRSGRTAEFVSDFRPGCPIIGVAVEERGMRQLNLRWGVKPVPMTEHDTLEKLFANAAICAKKTGLVKQGDQVVVVAGSRMEKDGGTDMIRVCEI